MTELRHCRSTRRHKAHLWSRTTRRTVTEETRGDTLRCPGTMVAVEEAAEDPRDAQIAADARSGTNWASLVNYGPACVCGAFRESLIALSFERGAPRGICRRHGAIQPSRITREEGPL